MYSNKAGIYLIHTNSSNISFNNLTMFGGGIGLDMGIRLHNSYSNTIQHNRINTSGPDGYAIRLMESARNNIRHNSIVTTNTSAVGIYLTTSSDNNTLAYNIINTSNDGSYGFFIEVSAMGNNISNNNITINGSLSRGINSNTNENNTIIEFNRILTYGPNSPGIDLHRLIAGNITINSNIINTSAVSSHGIILGNKTASRITGNVINVYGSNSSGIYLKDFSNNNLLLNNNITSNLSYLIRDETSTSYQNFLVYNNSLGEIEWIGSAFLQNLTLVADNINGIGLTRNLFIGSNISSLNTTAFLPLNINSTAEITLHNLSFASISQVIKDGEYRTSSIDVVGSNCLGNGCTQISYNGSTLVFSTTSLSSFRAE